MLSTRWLFLISLQISTAVCQYMMEPGVAADLRFGEQNERYDVDNIIMEQNRVFREAPQVEDMEQDYRRKGGADEAIPLVEVIKLNRRRANHENPQIVVKRRDYAYHDPRTSAAEDTGSYERNLANFRARYARRNLQRIDLNKYIKNPKKNQKKEKYETRKMKQKRLLAKTVTKLKKLQARRTMTEPSREEREQKKLYEAIINYLHQGKNVLENGRRYENSDNDVLLQNAVPVTMEIDGYIELP